MKEIGEEKKERILVKLEYSTMCFTGTMPIFMQLFRYTHVWEWRTYLPFFQCSTAYVINLLVLLPCSGEVGGRHININAAVTFLSSQGSGAGERGQVFLPP